MRKFFPHTVHSLQFKLMCVTLTLFCLFATVTTYSWSNSLTKQATTTSVNNLYSMLQISNSNFETALKDIDRVTALISSNFGNNLNSRIFNYLMNKETEDATLLQYRREAEDYIISLCNFKSYLNGLAVYDLDGNSLAYGPTMDGRRVLNQDWYQELMNSDKDVLFIPPHYYSPYTTQDSDLVFSIARPIRYHGELIGLVVADIKCSLLQDMFDIENINDYSLLVLDEETGTPIFPAGSAANLLNETELRSLMDKSSTSDGRFFTMLNGQNSLAVSQQTFITGWRVIGFVPYNGILADFLNIRGQVIFIALFCGILFILLVSLCTFLLSRNLRRLSRAVKKIDQENLHLDVDIRSKDESGQLYQQITFMIERIRELIAGIQRSEKEKRKSEMRALQAQINPHFLYNTLNTIKYLATLRGAHNIETVSVALSDMLHVNLSHDRFISVEEEIHYLQQYLEIQEYRYSGKFTCYFSVDEDVRDKMVPKLLLQPLVENALLHGLVPQNEQGILQVRVFAEDDKLHIRIKDNGKGMDEKKLASILESTETNSAHIGITNVRSRLSLLFGEHSSFSVWSEPNLYTTVEIEMPIMLKAVDYD
ncbi:cache domain-containing sensor histidine kinase [Paenibacillus segetis]|uniref:Sensor histidine kinase n=1 Tax=Paenibacillus segetis TaxID=1325360 RepID=A0ABQ1YJW9_9BACL|nr:sensor histidine kinase [Paenibacillus segetis]GGH28822.1 sensor histidine kinase [Paenibacillus segetis]